MKKNIYIGTMSGTSVDGLDIAVLSIEDNNEFKLISFDEFSYKDDFKNRIIKAITSKSNTKEICQLNFEIAEFYAEKINIVLKKLKLNPKDITAIGSHGQTVYHLPRPGEGEVKSTFQIGDGSVIAQLTGIDTVSDFRPADVGAGVEGAPLVPFGEYLMFNNKEPNTKRIWQNIGGISNSTLLEDKFEDIISFDNGPGNLIINYLVKKFFDKDYDDGGKIASKGKINYSVLNDLLKDEYFVESLPKTTGREIYGEEFSEKLIKKYENINNVDLLRTVTYLTAKTIADSYNKYLIKDNSNYEAIVSGGGSYNNLLMNDLKNEFANNDKVQIKTAEDIGVNSSAKEAILFALFAKRTMNKEHSIIQKGKKVILGKVSFC